MHRRDEVDGHVRDEAGNDDAAGDRPHVPDRDVAPPAVVEAEGDEDEELDREDEQDRPVEKVLIARVMRQPVVEAELEGQPPRGGDDHRIDEELPDPVRRDQVAHQTRLGTAERTAATTRSCASAGMPGQSGREKFSAAACSVAGSEPAS